MQMLGMLSIAVSPDGRLITTAVGRTAYVWDITSPDSHLVGTLVGHNNEIWSLLFSSPSSLISVSLDKSVKFWQIGVLPINPVMTNPESTQFPSCKIPSVGLQARAGIAISSDKQGVVKTRNISLVIAKNPFRPQQGYCLERCQAGRLWVDCCLV